MANKTSKANLPVFRSPNGGIKFLLRNPLGRFESTRRESSLKSTWQSLSMPFDHLLPVKVPPSPRKADEVGVHYHRGLRPKWTELVGLEGSLQRFQKEESLNWRGTKRSSNTIIMIFWPLAFMLLVVHYTNYVPEKERIKGKWSTVFENFQKCLIFLQTLLPPKIKFLELFKYLILGELVFNCLACKDVKLSHFMAKI